MVRVKICGLTTVEDTLAAIEAGADYLGFNFYPKSPRYISPAQCVHIRAALDAQLQTVKTVGIFVNETPERIRAIMAEGALDLAQLHGDESVEALTALAGRAYKAFRGVGQNHAAWAAAGPGAPAFLVDAYTPQAYGGTGQTVDWSAARELAGQYPIFLAGGLTPDNVGAAIAQVQPWGVDVASGVESAPGKKDIEKMRTFIQNARKTWEIKRET